MDDGRRTAQWKQVGHVVQFLNLSNEGDLGPRINQNGG